MKGSKTGKVISGVVALAFATFMLIGFNQSMSASLTGNDVVVLRLGHVLKNGSPVADAANHLAELVEERSGGKMRIEVYGSSQLGSQADLAEGLQIGTVDLTISSPAILSAMLPRVSVLDLPYIFTGRENAYAVLDDDALRESIFEGGDNFGFTTIAVWEGGFRQTTNSKHPVDTLSDYNGLKIRCPESSLYLALYKALGANPTPMDAGEVFNAMQNGTVDGQENTIAQIYSAQYYTVQKYLTLDNHIYGTQPLLLSHKTKAALSGENLQLLLECTKECTTWERDLIAKMEGTMLSRLEEEGMTISVLSDEELKNLKRAASVIWSDYEEKIGNALIDRVSNYNSKKGGI